MSQVGMGHDSMDGGWDGDDRGYQGWVGRRVDIIIMTVLLGPGSGGLPLVPIEDTTDTDCLCHRNLFRFSLLTFFLTEIISLPLRTKNQPNKNVQNRYRIKRKKITTECVRRVG